MLVGENNSGKSTFVKALSLFFAGSTLPSGEIEKHVRVTPGGQRKKRWTMTITLWFSDLPQSLSTQYHAYLNTSGALPVRYKYKDGRVEYRLFPNGSVTSKIESGVTDQTVFRSIGQKFKLIIVPEIRDPRRELETELADVFLDFKRMVIDEVDRDTQRQIDNLKKSVEKVLDRKMVNDLNKSLGNGIPGHTANLRLGAKNGDSIEESVLDALWRHVHVDIRDDAGQGFDLHEYGAGLRNLFVIALYKALLSRLGREVLFILEEPEAHMDPHAQRRIFAELRRLVTGKQLAQVLISTHSPYLADQANLEDIVLVRRDETTRATQLSDAFIQANNIRSIKATHMDLRNSELFFAKAVILCCFFPRRMAGVFLK